VAALLGVLGITICVSISSVGLSTTNVFQGSSGEDITRVPIVYSPRGAHSQSPYEARIHLSVHRTCRDAIRAHVDNIGAKFGDRNNLPEADNREQGEMSMDVLKGLFRNRPQFATDASIARFLGLPEIDEVVGNDDYEVYRR
jgi:hypothetical protein